MRTLLTGGAGFIGASVAAALLQRGHSVDIVDNFSTGSPLNVEHLVAGGRPARLHELDVCSPELLQLCEDVRPEVVCHLAAQSSVRTSVGGTRLDAESNVIGTISVLEAARAAGSRRLVYAASGGTLYGELAPEAPPAAESNPHRPISFYGISKKAGLDYLVAYHDLYGLDYCALALANVYGPGRGEGNEDRVVRRFVAHALADQQSVIYGDGNQTRDFVFLDDVAEAVVLAVESRCTGVYNIGTGEETSVNRLHDVIARTCERDIPPLREPPRPEELRRSVLDCTRARQELGWQPKTALEDGVSKTVRAALAPLTGDASPAMADAGGEVGKGRLSR